MNYLSKIKNKLLSKNVKLKGCTQLQINKIEEIAGNKLPQCYIEFLEVMGIYTNADNSPDNEYNYTGFEGESMFYEDLFDNKEALEEQLEEDSRTDLQLTDNDFVFFCHQGYIFAFFKLDEGDNPPVYGYQEGYKGETFPKLTDTLVEFYELYLEFGKSPFGNLRK